MINRIREFLEDNDVESALVYLDLLEVRMQEIDDLLSVLRKYCRVYPDCVYLQAFIISGADADIVKKVID